MTLSAWPKSKTKQFTPAQVRMMREGRDRADAAGWTRMEWYGDIAALFGCKWQTISNLCNRITYQSVE